MRIFITVDYNKILGMYKYNEVFKSNSSIFNDLPYYYSSKESGSVIVLSDNFTNWETYYPILETDFILYHSSSEANVKKEIKKNFIKYADGSHKLESPHDKAFQIIFDDTTINKAEEIIKIVEFEKIDAKEAFKKATKTLTLAYLKSQKNEVFQNEIESVENDIITALTHIKCQNYTDSKLNKSKDIVVKSGILIEIAEIYSQSNNAEKQKSLLKMITNFQNLSRDMENLLFNEVKE